jgi:hypothetical protein
MILGFEYASQPGLSDEEKENKLHFVVVGGGPTVKKKKNNLSIESPNTSLGH